MRVFEDDEPVRVVLIRANGKHFCTGADLDEVKGKRAHLDALKHFISLATACCAAMENSRLPVIGAVHGLALAGGLELMMAGDVAFAGKTARFGCQHAQFGLIPGWGGTQRLPRLVGERRALDLMFSARWISAQDAQNWGLVNLVVDDDTLIEQSTAYAEAISKRNPQGLAVMKSLARAGLDEPLATGLRRERASVGRRSALTERVRRFGCLSRAPGAEIQIAAACCLSMV